MVQHSYYLVALLISIGGLTVIDYRLKLAFFDKPKRALLTLGLSLIFFIAWDAAGIASKIFYYGQSKYSLGLMIAPEFPLEELFFLTLLIYSGLILYRLVQRV